MGEPDPEAVDYYSRIGVSPDADMETIERRRKQADRRFSPMSSSPHGDEKRHMQINAASSVLEDPAERERYDTFYDAFGRIEGTAVYETLDEYVADAVREDDRLLAHLRGFVQVAGPVDGARTFEEYYQQLDPPVPEAFEGLELPDGYAVDDPGFGVAAWSYRVADEPCAFDLWLTAGHDLWRAALDAPGEVPRIVADLQQDRGGASATGEAPTTRLEDRDTSPDIPSEYVPDDERGRRWPNVEMGRRTRRLVRTLSYLGRTGMWATGSTAVAAASGVASWLAAVVVFVPLLALGLVVRSSLPGVDTAVQSAVGVPLADPEAPLASVSLAHYLSVAVLVAVAAIMTGRVFAAFHRKRDSRLPRDAWLVFGVALAALTTTLFVGLRGRALPRPVAVVATALVTAFTFQSAMDVGAPRPLSRLCRSTSILAFGLAGAVAALVVAEVVASAAAPGAASAYAEILTGIGLGSPLFTLGNAEAAAVGFAGLALVPLVLTALYSLAYAVESIALRRRDPQRS